MKQACVLSLMMIAITCCASMTAAAELQARYYQSSRQAGASRSLRFLKIGHGIKYVHGAQAPAPAPAGHSGKAVTLGPLTVRYGSAGTPAPGPVPASAPEPQQQDTPAPPQQQQNPPAPSQQQQQQPAAPQQQDARKAPAPTSPPETLPRGAPVQGTSDIGQALSCRSAFDARGGKNGLETAIGDVCKEGSASFSALGCCRATAQVLNSGNLNRCACNNLVYERMCQEVKVPGLNCDTLRPTLVGCGLQC